MKSMIVIMSLVLASSTVFATTRGDIEAAFSFLYEKSSSSHAEQISKIYLAIVKIENSCLQVYDQFCDDNSVSPEVKKMIALQTKAYVLMGKPRTEKTIEEVKNLDFERDIIGQKLVDQVIKDLK